MKKKLIAVALPLDAINKAAAREKSIRRERPSTLYLWYARRPLARARLAIIAQVLHDPSARPDLSSPATVLKQVSERVSAVQLAPAG